MSFDYLALQATPGILLAPIADALKINQTKVDCAKKLSTVLMFFVLLLLYAPNGITANGTTSTETTTTTTTPSRTATLLFWSRFGAGVSLGPPRSFGTKGAWQDLMGTDRETGFSWPVKALGADFSGVQLITIDPITPSTIDNYITNEIRPIPEAAGKNEIVQTVKIKGSLGQAGSQAPLLIKRPWTIGDIDDLYITYWFKYPEDLTSKLDSGVSSANWRTQFSLKTGGYKNNAGDGDYRMSVSVMEGTDGKLYWLTKGDNLGGAFSTRVDYWREENRVVPVPVDQWFRFEVYWHRSADVDGRFWAAVNGKVIADYRGPNMGDYGLPITRIFVNDSYSGGYAPVESRTTGLEIWSGFPCGEGVSCYLK
ncbi:hypothetical protein [Nitrosomonas oligotropha]|uniref:hypothetical protein n=1 Tax=Nitrosomonas oligotropha TaxID=42354 RepID=UPI00136EE386|nr:hypothetical protein [Nitrosomonas oligotropha]MXS84239.1 hypothetical protein [Nitrosomonas oligotropha]